MTKKLKTKKNKPKTIKELTEGYGEFMKNNEHNEATKEDFEKAIKQP